MNTTENNKIISEFMSYKTDLIEVEMPEKFRVYLPFNSIEGSFGTTLFKLSELKFDTDWNWLMEVVEKIESIEEQRFLFQISTRQGFYAEIRERFSYETKIEDAYGETRIEAVYNACIEFIKWYNKNKINP